MAKMDAESVKACVNAMGNVTAGFERLARAILDSEQDRVTIDDFNDYGNQLKSSLCELRGVCASCRTSENSLEQKIDDLTTLMSTWLSQGPEAVLQEIKDLRKDIAGSSKKDKEEENADNSDPQAESLHNQLDTANRKLNETMEIIESMKSWHEKTYSEIRDTISGLRCILEVVFQTSTQATNEFNVSRYLMNELEMLSLRAKRDFQNLHSAKLKNSLKSKDRAATRVSLVEKSCDVVMDPSSSPGTGQ
ncbi:hypothetical protein F5Y18DRAFT_441474 [Xylariaceae sp. FL1019]|nr:hypothetical protein F5Y18DRAFT_441474 [Xylariaceae sp. FL1019]